MKSYSALEYVIFILIIGILIFIAALTISSSKKSVRDAKRLSDMKQIQAALELYYADNHSYPISENAITLGEGIDCQNAPCRVLSTEEGFVASSSDIALMPSVPSNPKSGGTPYKYISNGTTYYVQFALEKDLNDLKKGFVCAKPFSITSGSCQ